MAENAGRSLTALTIVALGGRKRFQEARDNVRPTVVVLALSEALAPETICAARQLALHHTNVLLHVAMSLDTLSTVSYDARGKGSK
jgi:hypothetical protein